MTISATTGQDLVLDLGGGVKMPPVRIKAGIFLMGWPDSDNRAARSGWPRHDMRQAIDERGARQGNTMHMRQIFPLVAGKKQGASKGLIMTAMIRPRPRLRRGQKLLLSNMSWQAYQHMGRALKDRNIYVTYDRGALEIMVISLEHERFKGLFGLLVFTLARFFGLKIGVFGSFTHQRKDLLRGLEPDQCFYLAGLAAVKGKRRINLKRDPPPDLAIEVDITRSSLDRMGIYAALGIAEVWRFDGKALQVYLLKEGSYGRSESSLTFPQVPVANLVSFLLLGQREDDVTMVEALENWLERISEREEASKRGRRK